MRKGFTMIELIFVIVILGVLASVAIPRLAATRDDAEVAKAATNLATAVSDIAAYYTAKGKFATTTTKENGKDVTTGTFKDMTNALDASGNLIMKGETCATVVLPGTRNALSGATAGKIEIRFTGKDAACEALQKLSSIQTLCGSLTSKEIGSGNNKQSIKNCEVQIGGSGGITW